MLATQLQERGIRIWTDGDKLKVQADPPLTDDLRQFIRDNKPALIAELTPPPLSADDAADLAEAREERSAICEYDAQKPTYHGFTLADLQAEAHPDEWAEVKDNPEVLQVFALSLLEDRQMAACVTPERFTKLARCQPCGTVLVPATWPTKRVTHELGGCARETVDECPSCPWCRLRHQGKDYPKPCPVDADGNRWPRPISWQGIDERLPAINTETEGF